MSRLMSLTLLFIVLVDNFYDNAVLSVGVTKGHIRKCRCRVIDTGRFKCHSPLVPKTRAEKKDLINCFCSKANRHVFPEFQEACGSWRFAYIIPLV
ncbi:hypothetical protein PAMA_014046 [Pampus argenteus]